MSHLKSLTPILALIAVGLNAYVFQEPLVGLITLVAFLLAIGLAFGPRLAPEAPPTWQISLGAMVGLAGASLLGSLIYYSVTVTTTTLMVALGVVALLATLANWSSETQVRLRFAWPKLDPEARAERLIFVLGLTALLGWWVALSNIQIIEPVRSLWLVLNPFSLVAIGVASVCALTLLYLSKTKQLGGLLLMGCIFSALSVVALWDPLESTCRHASLSIL